MEQEVIDHAFNDTSYFDEVVLKRFIVSENTTLLHQGKILYRGYYSVARRYEFFFRVAKQYFTHSLRSFVKYCFCHEKIKFMSSSRHVMFFLLYRQKDIDKIIEGNDRNYVIDNLTCEIMENKPLGSRM